MDKDELAALREASCLLLEERLRFHKAEASRAKITTVYANGARVADDCDEAVHIVELSVREQQAHTALFHSREAERFAEAIKAIEELED